MKAWLIGRPLDRRSGAEERTLEHLRAVVNVCHRDDSFPLHVERNGSADGGDRWNRRIHEGRAVKKPQPLSH